MHAASVNPEPGSNSRNHSILTSAKRIKSIPSLIALSLLFLELYSLSELSRYSIALTCFILISYCSIFKDHFASPFLRQLHYSITIGILCQHLFLIFLKKMALFAKCTKQNTIKWGVLRQNAKIEWTFCKMCKPPYFFMQNARSTRTHAYIFNVRISSLFPTALTKRERLHFFAIISKKSIDIPYHFS